MGYKMGLLLPFRLFENGFHLSAKSNLHLFWFCNAAIGPIKSQAQS